MQEILLHILSSTDAATLVSAMLVNHRLCGISLDSALNKLRPHHIIKGCIYLNKQVYADPKLLREVFQAYAVDRPWLVRSTTTVIRESGLTPVGWYVLQTIARHAAREAARDAPMPSLDEVWYVAWANIMCRSDTWCDAHTAVCYTPWFGVTSERFSVNGAARAVVRSAILEIDIDVVTVTDVNIYLLDLKLTNSIDIVKSAYQIAECLMLRKIDRVSCDKIKKIVKKHDLEDITIRLSPNKLPDNPWIQQFNGLY